SLAIWRHQNPVSRRALNALAVSLGKRKLWQFDPAHFLAGGPIDDRKAVKIGDLCEHPFRGAVRIGFETEHTHAALEMNRPDRLVGFSVDHSRDVAAGGTGHHEL